MSHMLKCTLKNAFVKFIYFMILLKNIYPYDIRDKQGRTMELRNVRTFLRVAELMSFSRAAEQLNYTQSAVTIQVKQLERELGVELFERIGKKIGLTRHGETFISYANDVVRAADAAVSFRKEPDTPRGPLRIGTVESLCTAVLPDVLEDLHAACPLVETVVRTASISTLTEMLNHNELDILYILDKKLNHSEWVKASEQAVDIVFVVSSRHKFANRSRIALREILDEPFILTEQGVNYRHELEQRLAGKGLKITPYLDIENTEIIIKLLYRDTNISFLPAFTVQDAVGRDLLSVVEVADMNIKMWKQLIYHRKKTVTPQMEFFIGQIRGVHETEAGMKETR